MVATLSDIFAGLSVRASMTEALDLKSRQAALAFSRSVAYDHGTGAGQVNQVWDDTGTVDAVPTPVDLDLVGGLTDAFGAAISMLRVKGLFVAAPSTNVNNVVIGGAAATQWQGPFGNVNDTISVRPGGIFAIACADATGWPAVGGASDLLRITQSGAGGVATYYIVILGCSA